jgi:cob(I)alamin adenosyltransferase
MRRGYVQVYTGNGKGKTTASLGLALRAAGAGMKVFIGQFIKAEACSEHRALERFADLISIRRFGLGLCIRRKPTEADVAAALVGLRAAEEAIQSKLYDMVILDEINVAVHLGLIPVGDVLRLMREKPPEVELVLTGRYADERVIAEADLVTEMRDVKHYFEKGVKARRGVEK